MSKVNARDDLEAWTKKKVRMRPKSKDLKSQTIDFDVVGNAGQTDAVKEV